MRALGCCALLLLAAGCSNSDCGSAVPAGTGPVAQQVVPDFGLLDANPTSATFDTIVSPRDLLGRTSAWYFGDAT